MSKFRLLWTALLVAGALVARTVRVEHVVCNPEATVLIPVTLDEAKGLSVVSLVLNYNAEVLTLLGVEQGELKTAFSFDFTVVDVAPGQVEIISVSPADITESLGGTLARLRFAVRKGTEAMYSDIALADVTFNEETMTVDLTATDPTEPKNGMVRAYGETAKCTGRLVEGALSVAPETKLDTLVLEAGDTLCVADSQKPIVVSTALTAAGAVRLAAPEQGWATATYEILQAPTAGLVFDPATLPEGATVTESTTDGITRYLLAVVTDTDVGVDTDIELLPADENAIRSLLEDELEGIATIRLEGDETAILAGIDLGIKPATTTSADVLTATFALPVLTVTAFDPKNGLVKLKVEPTGGGTIVRPVATGILHVYGSESLAQPMKEVDAVTVDLSAYQEAATAGEVSFAVQLGRYTFVKVVAGRAEPTADE